MKDSLHRFKKGYYRPVSMPIWKWMIVGFVFAIAAISYCASIIVSMWLLVVGIIFQFLAFLLMLAFDTENWKESQQGKEYLKEYYSE
jgi:quinol-cytochrome oxidoreductase complex cytochrome b subunit